MMVATPMLHPDRVQGARDLLSAAAESLSSAHWASTVHGRGAATRLAVLRAAAAVLAVRGRQAPPVAKGDRGQERGRSAGPVDMWSLLPRVAPELTEWADFFGLVFASGESEIPRPGTDDGGLMSVREVDDLLRQGEDFVQIVSGLLGLPPIRVKSELTSLAAPRWDQS